MLNAEQLHQETIDLVPQRRKIGLRLVDTDRHCAVHRRPKVEGDRGGVISRREAGVQAPLYGGDRPRRELFLECQVLPSILRALVQHLVEPGILPDPGPEEQQPRA